MKNFFKSIFSILKWVGRLLTSIRSLFFNLIFFGIVALIVVSLFHAKEPAIPLNSILKLTVSGDVIEQQTVATPVDDYLPGFLGFSEEPQETRLQDILDAIDQAKDDDNIRAILLDLAPMGHAGLNQLHEIGAALTRFRESGKPVIAAEDYYTQDRYFLAAHATKVFLNPMGAVNLTGLGLYRLYFQEALEKLKITFHVFQVGNYKSATEPFTRSSMSPLDRSQSRAWLTDLWNGYVDTVAAQRSITPEAINAYINQIPGNLREANGNLAQLALTAGLVDALKQRHEINRYLIELAGSHDEEEPLLVSFGIYLKTVHPSYQDEEIDRDTVALIVAEGSIVPGESGHGTIGAETMISLLRKARTTPSIKAVVIRLDSGGGSAFASELIRQELLQLKASGKPVLVSMGTLAASGAYWISADADEIWASPNTLTGSIGIFMAFPTFENTLSSIGIRRDGIGTANLSAGFDLTQPISPEIEQAIQMTLENGYETFRQIVADGRKMTIGDVERIAQGRVFSGKAALANGLIDKLGTLDDAIRSAASTAKLVDYAVSTLTPPLSLSEQLFLRVSNESRAALGRNRAFAGFYGLLGSFDTQIQALLFNDPNNTYAHSLLPRVAF